MSPLRPLLPLNMTLEALLKSTVILIERSCLENALCGMQVSHAVL